MIAYVDASVILRVVLGQPGRLAEWGTITTGVASELATIECLRVIDRLRLERQLSVEDAATHREAIFRVVDALELVELTRVVLRRAGQPMPAPLGTLDAIHLSTAALWREARGVSLTIATHDRALALAARADGFAVAGV